MFYDHSEPTSYYYKSDNASISETFIIIADVNIDTEWTLTRRKLHFDVTSEYNCLKCIVICNFQGH